MIGQNIGGIKQDNNEVNVYWLNTVPFYNMPDIKIGEYYTNGVEIRVPRDTITSISGSIRRVKLKKLKLISVQNIPNGLSYSPTIIDNADESFFRLQLKVYGRVASITTANIKIKVGITFTVDSGKSLVRTFEINNVTLRKARNSHMETYSDKIGLKGLESYPNHVSNKTEVRFWSSKLQLVEFEVRDAIGNLKYKKTFTAKVGSNKVSFSQDDLKNGLYLYSIKTEDQLLAKRLIIK
ncbi:MAG: T9SS type A sorting domain-containing protein [Flavobacteriales bacterium]|nr:T9SS type A sorting domain-containing protein [Flavobacteriales bacterium]